MFYLKAVIQTWYTRMIEEAKGMVWCNLIAGRVYNSYWGLSEYSNSLP